MACIPGRVWETGVRESSIEASQLLLLIVMANLAPDPNRDGRPCQIHLGLGHAHTEIHRAPWDVNRKSTDTAHIGRVRIDEKTD